MTEALVALQRGHMLGSKRPDWRYPSAQWVRQAEHLATLEEKLSAMLAGKYRSTDNPERLELAEVCLTKKRYVSAADLYAATFTSDLKLADDLQAGHRCNAACAATLAADGQGEGAAKLDKEERARLRQQALAWLNVALVLWAKHVESGTPQARAAVQKTLHHWQQNPALAGLRDAAALDKLPEPERAECKKLWAEVETLLKKSAAGGKK